MDVGEAAGNATSTGVCHSTKNMVFFSTVSQGTLALDSNTGKLMWSMPGLLLHQLALDEDTLYGFIPETAVIVAIDINTQSITNKVVTGCGKDINFGSDLGFQIVKTDSQTALLWQCNSQYQYTHGVAFHVL